MNTKRTTAIAIVAVAAFGLSGCGSSSGTPAASPSMSGMPSMSPSMSEMPSASSPSSSAQTPSGSSAQTPNAAARAVITIKDFAYQGPKTVSPGAKITVKDDDSAAHTVTADSGDAFDVTVKPGESVMLTAPDKPGSYPYHCNFHAGMKGTLVVK